MHLTSSPVDWYAARAAGVAAYVLLTCVVALGIALAGRAPRRSRRWPMFAVEEVHRSGGLLVGSFVVLHVLTIAVDSYLPFSLAQLAVPLTSAYRPLWVALGIVAAELLLALAVTNHYRRRLPYRLWRRAHYLNFAVWAAATLHGLGSGTDRGATWMIALETACVAAVLAAVAWRLARSTARPLRPAGVLGVVLAGPALVLLLALGPLHPHPRPWNAATFADTLTGSIRQQTAVTRAVVSMSGSGHGGQDVLVRADLLVAPDQLLSTSFQMEYLASGAVCRGRVDRLGPFSFHATCRLADGSRRHVQARWHLETGRRLRGRLVAQG